MTVENARIVDAEIQRRGRPAGRMVRFTTNKDTVGRNSGQIRSIWWPN